MAKWVKSRLCKHATLSSDPRQAQKSQVFTALVWLWRRETLRVRQPASLANQPAPSSAGDSASKTKAVSMCAYTQKSTQNKITK